jgi:hypothetical protein
MKTTWESGPVLAANGRPGGALEVERGPDWLFVKVAGNAAGDAEDLTRCVWETIREHGASRVVLELDHVDTVDEALGCVIGEIGMRVRDAGGLIRICGLTQPELSQLRSVAAAARVPHFDTRSDAVGGREAGS